MYDSVPVTFGEKPLLSSTWSIFFWHEWCMWRLRESGRLNLALQYLHCIMGSLPHSYCTCRFRWFTFLYSFLQFLHDNRTPVTGSPIDWRPTEDVLFMPPSSCFIANNISWLLRFLSICILTSSCFVARRKFLDATNFKWTFCGNVLIGNGCGIGGGNSHCSSSCCATATILSVTIELL